MEKAMEAAPSRADSDLKIHYLAPLYKAQYPPKANVRLQGKLFEAIRFIFFWLLSFEPDMHLGNTSCKELVQVTADAIDDDVLKLLFVSVQQVNLAVSVQYACKT